jgi:hypothetical protein
LEGAEQAFRIAYAASCIAELHSYALRVSARRHREFASSFVAHRPLGILRQVEEYLHQALAVSPHGGQTRLDLPVRLDFPVLERGLDHNPQLLEK